jgi:hypothetical protein
MPVERPSSNDDDYGYDNIRVQGPGKTTKYSQNRSVPFEMRTKFCLIDLLSLTYRRNSTSSHTKVRSCLIFLLHLVSFCRLPLSSCNS